MALGYIYPKEPWLFFAKTEKAGLREICDFFYLGYPRVDRNLWLMLRLNYNLTYGAILRNLELLVGPVLRVDWRKLN
jgi:hypothetical protein